MKRASGVLMHVSSLWGEYSIGGFSKSAYEFIDFLNNSNFTYWQVLPFTMCDDYNSPYMSYSAFSVNPYFIDLEELYKNGYIEYEDLEKTKQKTPYSCEYDRLKQERINLLEKASLKAPKKLVEEFILKHSYLNEFSKFMALKEQNDLRHFKYFKNLEISKQKLFKWQFICYEFYKEWLKIKKYANDKGVKIIGDIPMYVSYDSSDVYYHKDLFLMDKDYNLKGVAGVPPDYFSKDGQVWGNPLYDWEEMEKQGFKWWKDRFSYMLELFDGVRIDHFRGLESFYSIPFGEKTAVNGKWVKAKGKEFIDAIKPILKDKLVIAEDLGDITKDVIDLVKYSGFPNMRVMQFGYLGREDSTHRIHNYDNNCVAYTGTHDNNTLLGYVWELNEESRNFMLNYFGYKSKDFDKSYDIIIENMFRSSAGVVILPIQDLLLFGSDTRLNMPGRAKGNWEFRITKDNLNSINKERYKNLNNLYSR